MPAKFKESIKNRDGSVQNFYLKSTPKQELLDYLDNHNARPKIKVKVQRELVRRGHKC